MTTVVLPPPPADADAVPPPSQPAPQSRAVRVYADLMPPEVVAARRGRELRGYIALAMAAVLLLVVGWTVAATLATSSAQHRLDHANAQANALHKQQSQFSTLLNAQSASAAIQRQLKALMADDVAWAKLLDSVRNVAPSGVTVTNVVGSLLTGAGPTSASTSALTNLAPGVKPIGTLQITGTAASKDQVAAFLDAVGKLPTLAVPFLTGTTSANGHLTFTATALITSSALGGRFTSNTGSK